MGKTEIFIGLACLAIFSVFVEVQCGSFEDDIRISLDQKVAIDKLRRRVLPQITENYMKEDIYLVRWLRATNFNIDQAEKSLLENLKWRKEQKMPSIDEEDFSDVSQDYPFTIDPVDKEGRPYLLAFAGDWDLRTAVMTGKIKRVLRYCDQGMEMMARKIRKMQAEGKNVTQCLFIVELGSFNVIQHACPQCLLRIVDFLRSYEDHFPGMAEKVIFLDAPPAVQFVLELVKQTVSQVTRDSMTIYGTNRPVWKKAMQKLINKDQLPPEFGGTYKLSWQ